MKRLPSFSKIRKRKKLTCLRVHCSRICISCSHIFPVIFYLYIYLSLRFIVLLTVSLAFFFFECTFGQFISTIVCKFVKSRCVPVYFAYAFNRRHFWNFSTYIRKYRTNEFKPACFIQINSKCRCRGRFILAYKYVEYNLLAGLVTGYWQVQHELNELISRQLLRG